MDISLHAASATPEAMFDWEPDADRLEREVRSAEIKGLRDDLTLAEIECSIDLLDAEISGLRLRAKDESERQKLTARGTVRHKLASLASRLSSLPG